MKADLKKKHVRFGDKHISLEHVFYLRKNVFGLVNSKPLCEGHLLIVPRHKVERIYDLSEVETLDLWYTVKEVASCVEKKFGVTPQIIVQDGEAAGQTIKHSFVHIIPIKAEAIQDALKEEKEERSDEEMRLEAADLMAAFKDLLQD